VDQLQAALAGQFHPTHPAGNKGTRDGWALAPPEALQAAVAHPRTSPNKAERNGDGEGQRRSTIDEVWLLRLVP